MIEHVFYIRDSQQFILENILSIVKTFDDDSKIPFHLTQLSKKKKLTLQFPSEIILTEFYIEYKKLGYGLEPDDTNLGVGL
jgi:hypothetical protein